MFKAKKIISSLLSLRIQTFSYYYRPKNQLKQRPQQLQLRINKQKQKSMQVYNNNDDIELADRLIKLNLKQFSVQLHKALINKQKSQAFWIKIQNQFFNRLIPTTQPQKIRSFSKILYCLSKSKKSSQNYQTKFGLLLPFASPSSFTQIITSCSRLGPFSQEYSYIVQRLYYKRKQQFNPRQIVTINYTLSNNNRQCDNDLINYIDHFNCVQTINMLRCYDKSQKMTNKILKIGFKKILAIQAQINALDLADLLYIYLKYQFKSKQLDVLIQNSYNILKKNINDISVQKIWTYIPQNINKGNLTIKFINDVIATIHILRKTNNMSEVIWKRIQLTFKDINNIEIKLKLQKIY